MFLPEEERPPVKEPQIPVVYSQVDVGATLKLRQDAELKNHVCDEPHDLPRTHLRM